MRCPHFPPALKQLCQVQAAFVFLRDLPHIWDTRVAHWDVSLYPFCSLHLCACCLVVMHREWEAGQCSPRGTHGFQT